MEATTSVITLPSNSSSDVYPDNTTGNFRVELAKALEFEGPHEVALTGFCYPKTWYNFPTRYQYWIRLTTVSGTLPMREIELANGHYDSMADLLKSIQRKIDRHNYPVTFWYSPITQKVKIYCAQASSQCESIDVVMSGRLGLKLGFIGMKPVGPDEGEEEEWQEHDSLPPVELLLVGGGSIQAPYPVQLDTIDLLYVNCDLASDAHVVGGMRVPLLKTVAVTGVYGSVVSYEPRVLDWLPLRHSRIKTITVLITDGEGRPVPFERGQLTVKVHVRRARPI